MDTDQFAALSLEDNLLRVEQPPVLARPVLGGIRIVHEPDREARWYLQAHSHTAVKHSKMLQQ